MNRPVQIQWEAVTFGLLSTIIVLVVVILPIAADARHDACSVALTLAGIAGGVCAHSALKPSTPDQATTPKEG